jgi:hypothetical protein
MSSAELEKATGLSKLSCETHTHAADGCIDHVMCSVSKSGLQRAGPGAEAGGFKVTREAEATASDQSILKVDVARTVAA